MRRLHRAAFLAAVGAVWFTAPAAAERLAVSTRAVELHPGDSSVRRVGALEYRGGLDLRSRDRRFGGLSALAVDRTGNRLLALTDKGNWVELAVTYGANGDLAAIGEARIGALGDLNAGSVAGTRLGDAEAIAPTRDGYAVGFESRHRIWLYRQIGVTDPAKPQALRLPPQLHRAPANRGIEALAILADGRLFALTERLKVGKDHVRGWITVGRGWRALRYRRTARFLPTGAATLAGGDVLVLERRFTWLGGFGSRIVRVRGDHIRADAALEGSEIATIDPPLTSENFEGIAVRPLPGGGAYIYLVSDDNFHALQRTLLLMFEYRG